MKRNKRFILFIVIAVALGGILLYFRGDKDAVPETSTHIESSENDIVPLTQVFNVLLIGTDIEEENETFSRSDTIMIVSIDPVQHHIKLTSILRDSYVEVPGYGGYRINEAYALGGPELLMGTINHAFGLDIDHFAQVDFDAFASIIDVLGGIDIVVDEAESKDIFGEYRTSGNYHLTGQQALNYCRIRKIDTDFSRTARQRTVLYAMYNKVQAEGEDKLLALFPKVYPAVHTNMGLNDVIVLFRQYQLLEEVTLEQMHLPVEGAFEEKAVYGQDVLLLDFAENTKAFHRFLYGDQAEIPETVQPPEIPAAAISDPSWMVAQREAIQNEEADLEESDENAESSVEEDESAGSTGE